MRRKEGGSGKGRDGSYSRSASEGHNGSRRSAETSRHDRGGKHGNNSYVAPNKYGTYRPRGNTRGSDTYYRGSEYSTSGRSRSHVNDEYGYGNAGHYGSNSVQQYSRSNYAHNNAGMQKQKRRGKHTLAITIAVVAVAIAAVGIFWYYHTMPVTVTVNGTKAEFAYNTTYSSLHDQGYLVEDNGDFVAVDGTVLTKGGGQTYKVYVNGEQTSVDKRLKKDATITEEKGDNITEDYTIASQDVAWTWDASGSHHSGSLGLTITQGSDGVDCIETGSVSGRTVKSDTSTAMTPRTCRWYNVTVPSDQKVIAITFDDGPSDRYTQQILDVLSENGAVATFFELGQNVERYPSVSKAVVDQGSQVASHSYDHPYYFTTIGENSLKEELRKAQEAIYNATGVTTTTVRAPGGEFDAATWSQTGDYMKTEVYWNVDTQDWEKPGTETIVSNAVSNAKNGRIILMHDGGGNRDQTVAALKEILPQLKAQGYTFVTIDQLSEIQMNYLRDQGVITDDGKLGTAAA